MSEFTPDRRRLLRGLAAAGGLAVGPAAGAASPGTDGGASAGADAGRPGPETDPHTLATYRAVVDAVIPPTPELADLGDEHVPGGPDIDLGAYVVTYVNTLFSAVGPAASETGDLRLAEPLAAVLDEAATELLARGGNADGPDPSRFPGGGPFASLSRDDRLAALALFDEKEFDTTGLPGPLVESDGGIVPQLMVGFVELVYYSEWQGYEEFTVAPSERSFENDPAAVQSWRQTDFPGFADGYAAFRGYWGGPDCSLGAGRVWKRVDGDGSAGGGRGDGSGNGGRDDVSADGGRGGDDGREHGGPPRTITFESGEFRENDYDTSGYEEPFPEEGSSGGER